MTKAQELLNKHDLKKDVEVAYLSGVIASSTDETNQITDTRHKSLEGCEV